MKNTIKLSGYTPFSDIAISEINYVFSYNLLVAEIKWVEKYINKWISKPEVLGEIQGELMKNSNDWQIKIPEAAIDSEIDSVMQISENSSILNLVSAKKVKYIRDLRGVRIYDSVITQYADSLNYTRFDYSLIQNSDFIGVEKIVPSNLSAFSGFFGASFNYSRFSNCTFVNCNFWAGEYKHVVFDRCIFKGIKFNINHDGIYSHILFQNCELINVDFSKVDIKSFCFFGDCKIENVIININDSYEDIIGSDIINFTKTKDCETYGFRKSVKAVTYSSNGESKYVFYEENEIRKDKLKYAQTSNVYNGLATFYHSVNRYYELQGEYALACNLQYNFSYCKDEVGFSKKTWQDKIRIIINRDLLGYGWKYKQVLFFLIIMTFLMSFIYLFTGIHYNDILVERLPSLDLSQIRPTILDWLRCLYFSLKTTTAVGHGNFLPASILSLILSFTQGIIGFIVFTIFVVIFSRRFFK